MRTLRRYNANIRISAKRLFAVFAFHSHRSHYDYGYAALTATLLTVIVSLTIIGAFTFLAFQEVNTTRTFTRSIESRYVSEGGIEDALYRVIIGKQIASGETLAVGKGTTTITLTTAGDQRLIRSEGKRDQFQQNLETRVDVTVAGVNFPYGAQVGEGGLEMNQNSRVIGSVFANGSIIGDSGAEITGDAFVASGTPPTINQSWETQNSDVAVGVSTGSVITVVDSAGSVGAYTSLVLGSDGFPRISYVDETNSDLKFARCLDADCVNRNLTTVDSAGEIDEVTSTALGLDGLPRISYYHDGNDDLKFGRCTDADCAARVLTLVETSNNVGDFSSLKIGSDGFARIAYWYDTGRDVRFARCLNEDCTLRNIRNVDTTGNVGEYISLALGADGFGRMSYYDDSNKDLKFARCNDDDCSSAAITTVDSTGSVGKFTSLVLGADGFARVSYFNETNGDLKLARCLNDTCTSRNIATVDSTGTVGQHTSIALGQDGFPRISYYDSSNGDLKFARCLNADCTSAETTTVDNASSVGLYTSLAIGPDGFGRISYWDQNNRDLKFVRCSAPSCPPSALQVDVAQSFQPTVTDRVVRVDLRLKKVGNPSNATIRIITDSGGRPSSSAGNVLAVGALNAALVGSSYSWLSVWLTTTPTINANTTYWIVVDSSRDDANYYVWGGDSNAGYTRGNALASADWQSAVWNAVTEDLNFRVFMGGADNGLDTVTVGGNAKAHVVNSATVTGNVDGFNVSNATITGNVNANSLTDCTVNGNASYNSVQNCTILGSRTTPTTPPSDLAPIPLPIATSTIDGWKTEAVAGGICVEPECQADGDFDPSACEVSLGPRKITGNLILNASCSGGQLLTVTGTIWVAGNVDISNNARINLAGGYGEMSGVIVADGTIHLSNNGTFQGSGASGSYLMLLTTATGGGHHGSAIDLHNNASGAIFYAGEGMVWLHQNVNVTELVGKKIHLENNATLTYEIGLQDLKFSSGPAGGYDVKYWREVE